MNEISLRDYQREAIDNWFNNSNRGIFEMATGTGKTYTALACLKKLSAKNDSLVTVITAPSQHLLPQWKKSIESFPISSDKIVIADSTNNKWFDEVSHSLIKIYLNNNYRNLIILTTHNTFSGNKFMKTLTYYKRVPYFVIGDEMHGLGSTKYRNGLRKDLYEFRLGLSATPVRFKDVETKLLFDFFKDTVFEFSLSDAINSHDKNGKSNLTKFYYKPYFLSLTGNELKRYKEITKKLSRLDNDDERYAKTIENLYFQRANLIKDASNKIDVLNTILDDMQDFNGLIIYCSHNQIDEVCEILSKRSIEFSRFTQDTCSKTSQEYGGISQREDILNRFSNGKIEVLVAIHCLDEGVDIPQAKQAILMASSNSSREFIQRVGRVIRKHDDKRRAYIYDLIVKPQLDEDDSLKKFEDMIFEKEKIRCKKIGDIAVNTFEVRKKLDENI